MKFKHPIVWRALIALSASVLLLAPAGLGVSAQAPSGPPSLALTGIPTHALASGKVASPSGVYHFKDVNFGTGITECPQARLAKVFSDPPDRRVIDQVERYSERGNDRRVNEEYSCFPQNETTIDTNPVHGRNLVAGANDYKLGFPFTGVYASNDHGKTWYGAIVPFPSAPASPGNAGFLPSGGDPAVTFDREGAAYIAQIAFWRHNDDNGITVARSTNGGFTWSRACVPINVGTPTDDLARCGGVGDPRQPGDGSVVYTQDNNNMADFSVTFHDKEYIAAGPRPAGVSPVCFTPETKTPTACPAGTVGADRIYVTWTAFNNTSGVPFAITSSTIEMSFSDDRGHSWSPRKTINGSAPFCAFATAGPTRCDDNQFSVPTVSPHSGHLYVAFENFNTPDENQWLVVRSKDGGATFEGPFFVTPAFDVNLRSNRPDCLARGSGSAALTNTCFRVPQTGAIVADKRGGSFADDLYLVMSDNRNGTRDSTNTDVFVFKSLDGGSNWIGPTRVNNDPSDPPANRDCGRSGQPSCPPGVNTGNDQWWPWIDINDKGHLNIAFSDRRLDVNSQASEWPTSRTRLGNYLVWYWGAQCTVRNSSIGTCMAPGAAVIPQPTMPINPGGGPQPGQGPAFLGPFRNFGISDVPSNYDYCFRAGIFCGDYHAVAVASGDDDDNDEGGNGGKAYAFWTDARNGRSSRNQAGRNPACEQSDVMVDRYNSEHGSGGQDKPRFEDIMFLVTPCPADSGRRR